MLEQKIANREASLPQTDNPVLGFVRDSRRELMRLGAAIGLVGAVLGVPKVANAQYYQESPAISADQYMALCRATGNYLDQSITGNCYSWNGSILTGRDLQEIYYREWYLRNQYNYPPVPNYRSPYWRY
jgi:hypothetical protein